MKKLLNSPWFWLAAIGGAALLLSGGGWYATRNAAPTAAQLAAIGGKPFMMVGIYLRSINFPNEVFAPDGSIVTDPLVLSQVAVAQHEWEYGSS